MKQPDSNILTLILRYCQRTINDKEFLELETWINENPENKQRLSKDLIFFKNVRRIGFIDQCNEEEAWESIQRKIQPKRVINLQTLLRYAAIAILPLALAITVYFVFQTPDSDSVVAEVQLVEPGGKKAILYGSDGKEINLEESFELVEIDGTVIENKSNSIVYSSKEEALPELVYNTLYIPRKGEFQLQLTDGTKVWLNSDTKLIYPTQFGKDKREVELVGEAYFEVTKESHRPFFVVTSNLSVEVLGTSFNVKSYNDEKQIETTLVSGSIKLANKFDDTSDIVLEPGNQAIMVSGEKEFRVQEVETKFYTSWKEGMFTFKKMPLSEIMKIFSRWYDVEVNYENPELKKLHFTGNLERYKEINPHLELISLTTDVEFKITGKRILIKTKS